LHFLPFHKPTLKNAKELPSQCTTTDKMNGQTATEKEQRRHNSTYPKGGVSCSKDSFVVNQTLVFQIKFCGKSPALRVAAKR
jgi:hypothetical protein